MFLVSWSLDSSLLFPNDDETNVNTDRKVIANVNANANANVNMKTVVSDVMQEVMSDDR